VKVDVIASRRNYARMSIECLLKSVQMDLIDAQFVAPSGVIAALTPRAAPFVVTVHRWDILEFPHRWPMARAATLMALNSARGIIAVGRTIMDEAMKLLKPSSRTLLLPNAVDTQRFRPGLDLGNLKRGLGIPEDHLVVLSVGHLVPRKGFQFLVQAMATMRDSEKTWLVIVGAGPMREELKKMGDRLGLENRLKLPGAVDNSILPRYYDMADIFAMPSLSEGHCVSILEGMASGKPIVASAIGANAESVVDGYNGFLVPVGNIMALCRSISRLLNDSSLRIEFGRNSRERAIREFPWSRRVDRLVDFYKSVI
jgi:phosphatidylinositol alpha-1,6-mannosyltransferase